MTINHVTKPNRRMFDNQLYERRADAAIITLSLIVMIICTAVLTFIWAHPVS
ncbi:MAG TPA: hypothetical protein VGF48_05780 [Thermoanaerobaculia bacterium]